MLSIELIQNTEKRLYEQIYEYIREEIREGKLLTEEKLPSARLLAEYLNVSRSTIDLAYAQLVSEGYIEARPYKGYYVCKVEELFWLHAEESTLRGQAGNRGVSGKRVTGNTEDSAQKEMNRQFLYDFSPYAISMSQFPYATWKKITGNILVDANSEMFALGEPQGDYELRTTISRYLHASRGVNCSAEQIVIGAGNDYLLMLLEKILGEHLRIAMENPSYKRASNIFTSFSYEVCAVSMDDGGIAMKELKKSGADLAYVMPSHQFPTGIVMPIGRRFELLKWAKESENRYLIEDDYDSEFRYKGKPIPSLQASDRGGKVIYLGTFSKAIAPAIRVSYMVLPPALLEIYHQKCYFYSSTVSRIDQRILNEFIRDGYFERYLNKMRKYYKEKHDLLLEELKPLEKKFVLSGENGGLHILLHARTGRKESELIEQAAAAGVRVYGISETYLEAPEDVGTTVLLGYAALSEQDIKEGTGRLKSAWL